LEEINPAGFPLFITSLTLYSLFEKETGDTELMPLTVMVKSGENVVANVSITVAFQGKPRTRLLADMTAFVVPQGGPLLFELSPGAAAPLYSSVSVMINAPQPPPAQIVPQPLPAHNVTA